MDIFQINLQDDILSEQKNSCKSNLLLLILFLFEVLPKGIPSVFSTRKIAFCLMLAQGLLHGIAICRRDLKRIEMLVFLSFTVLIYAILVAVVRETLNRPNTIFARNVYFILYALIGSIVVIGKYRDEYEFMEDIIKAMLFQAAMIYAIFFSTRVKQLFYFFLNNEGNVDYLRTDRVAGLGAEAGYLTYLLYLGVFSCNYIILSKGFKYKYIVYQIILLAAAFCSGRTGIYFSLATIAFSLCCVFLQRSGVKVLIKYSTAFLTMFFAAIAVLRCSMTDSQFYRLWNRLLRFFTVLRDDPSIKSLNSQYVPPINRETLFGLGIYRGIAPSGTKIQSDGGYYQMYGACGLIVAILFYFLLFLTLLRMTTTARKNSKLHFRFFVLYIAIMIVAEYKEPFVLKYMTVFYFITAISLFDKRAVKLLKYYNC